QSRRFTAPPQSCPNRTASKQAAVTCAVCQLDALAFARKDDRVLPDDVPAAESRITDVAAIPRSRMPIAHPDAALLVGNASPLGCSLAKHECSPGRGIDLMLVVHFQDFDVEIVIERLSNLACQGRQQVY